MNATQKDEAEIEAPSKDGVGQHLRKAREALDLGRAEAAAGLYLSESIIVALEANDHDALPGPVFVQGYLRKYARLLNIPEEPLLEIYSHQAAPHKHNKKHEGPLAGSPIKPEISSNHTIVRLITWVIALGLLALVAVWWQGDMQWPIGQLEGDSPTAAQDLQSERSFAPDLPEPDDSSLSKDAAEEQRLSESAAPESVVMPASRSEAAVADDNPVEQAQDKSPEVAETGTSVAGEVASTQGLALDTALGGTAEALSKTGSMAEEEVQSDASLAGGAEQMSAPPIDYANSIVIEFAEACWTEIRGFNSSYKLLGNMQKGKRYVLGGEPPYTFVLGNSQAVTLTIKGRQFDIKAHSKGNIARFVLQAEDIPNS